MQFLKRAYHRFTDLVHEFAKFGTIGAIAFVLDLGLFNLLNVVMGIGVLSSKVGAAVVATTFAYLGNRYWTFRHREQSGLGREYFLFFLLNGIGLLISLLVLGFTEYTLKLSDPISTNVANLIGVGLGTLFRYWSYKRWVFLEATEPIPTELPAIKQDR
ncbi:GtrA family protein [Nonomuraea sp. NPDC050328]|uniref:GtrA family protein n=1 Tax=Nonomuraea sp. NPDC050328 TaxID=3364361 RepID=UPI0037A2B3E8